MRVVRRALLALVLLSPAPLLLSLSARTAVAKEEAKETKASLVVILEGAGGEKLKSAIGASLPEPWARADAKSVAKAAKTRKLAASPKALDKPKTKGPYLEKLAQVTEDVGGKAALVVRVAPGKKRKARVLLVSTVGSTLVDTVLTLDAPANDAALVQKSIANELAILAPSKEPEAAPPTPAAAVPPKAEPPPEKVVAPVAPPTEAAKDPAAEAVVGVPPPTETTRELPPVLEATLAMELATRHIGYRDLVSSNLKPYSSGAVPTPSVALDFYPLARSGVVFLQDLGMFGDFKRGLGQSVDLPDGTRIPIVWTRVDAGAKLRIRVGRGWHVPAFYVSGSYGQESFLFRDPNPAALPLDTPSVAYRTLRPRLEVRLPLGPLGLLVGGGYLAVLSSGELSGRLRDAKVGGLEADGALVLPIVKSFELRAGGAYRRFFYSFTPAPGDATVAGGALDEIVRADFGMTLRL